MTTPLVEIFTLPGCFDCQDLKGRLDAAGIKYTEWDMDNPEGLAEAMDRGVSATPTVFVTRTSPLRAIWTCDDDSGMDAMFAAVLEAIK